MPLRLEPLTITEAKRFVKRFHRHHEPPAGALFAIGASDGEEIVGAAIVGRPVGRRNQDGYTAEVTRLATDGTRNACSFLYAACRRACKAMGYRRLITYILAGEPGTSLKAAGWQLTGETPGRSWSVPSRERVDKHPLGPRLRFEAVMQE